MQFDTSVLLALLMMNHHKIFCINSFNAVADKGLVNKSAKFSVVCTFAILKTPAATASLTLWYAIELCFFFKVDVGTVALVTTDLLSQKTFAAPSIGTPNIRSLYLRDSSISTQIQSAMNSEPKVDASTVLWAFEYQMIGEQFKYIRMPV